MKKIISLLFMFIGLINAVYAYSIINIHDHISSINEAEKLIEAMDENNITKMVLLGSPAVTIGKPGRGMSGIDENNEEILKIVKKYPDRFIAFPTINPKDKDKLEKFKRYVKEGAKGLKLYSGHGDFYELSLDDDGMYPIYKYCEDNNLPIMFHVNGYKYRNEFENVLSDFPDLKIICPHFCLLSYRLDELRDLMDKYPNLYTDVSFGRDRFLIAGLKAISNNIVGYRGFFYDYSDRIFFGTDAVITGHPQKTKEWIINNALCYKNMLEKEKYNCFLINETLNGIGLDEEKLKQIYEENPKKILKEDKENKLFGVLISIIIVMIGLIIYFFIIKKKK